MSEIKPVATWETHCKRNPSCAEQAHLYASEAKSIEIEELRAAYEALQKENKALSIKVQSLNFDNAGLSTTVMDWQRLYENSKAESAAQAKRIAELEAGVVDIRDWTARWTRPDHPIVTVANRLLPASKNGE